jgi:hypothetical protein
MRSLYARRQRDSIYDTATIGDIPQEVLRKTFIYLIPGKSGLVAPSKVCQAWRPVAQELRYKRLRFGEWAEGRCNVVPFVAGIHLQSLVFGLGSVSINRLELDMKYFCKEDVVLLARFVAPSITIIHLDFYLDYPLESCYSSSESFEILEAFFLYCRGIRALHLEYFDVGEDLDAFSPSIKEGFSRLKKLKMIYYLMLVENMPIYDLQDLAFGPDRFEYDEYEKIINYRCLHKIHLNTSHDPSLFLPKLVEYCQKLEEVAFYGGFDLKLYCCRGSGFASSTKSAGHLESLDMLDATGDAWMVVYANCPSLQSLSLYGEEMPGSMIEGLK